jgi:hypothetical protein
VRGLTEARKLAANVWIQESCQSFYERDWPAMFENPIAPRNGAIEAPEDAGFGMKIKPEAWNHPSAVRQISFQACLRSLTARGPRCCLPLRLPPYEGLRMTGAGWFATPFLWDSFIPHFMPVYLGVHRRPYST